MTPPRIPDAPKADEQEGDAAELFPDPVPPEEALENLEEEGEPFGGNFA